MKVLDLILVLAALAGAAAYLWLRFRRKVLSDDPACCSGCDGCPRSAGDDPNGEHKPAEDPRPPGGCPDSCPGCFRPPGE